MLCCENSKSVVCHACRQNARLEFVPITKKANVWWLDSLLVIEVTYMCTWGTNINWNVFWLLSFCFLDSFISSLFTSIDSDLCIHKSIVGRPGQTVHLNPNKLLLVEIVVTYLKNYTTTIRNIIALCCNMASIFRTSLLAVIRSGYSCSPCIAL